MGRWMDERIDGRVEEWLGRRKDERNMDDEWMEE
jgi:hypothetical protein